MLKFEYKVVPAPTRGLRAKGVKGAEAKFAHALEAVMNEYGAQGWEYQRTDTLPSEERKGLTGRVTHMRHMLVFRRELMEKVDHPLLPPVAGEERPRPDRTRFWNREDGDKDDPSLAAE